jgi:hypothetical protein
LPLVLPLISCKTKSLLPPCLYFACAHDAKWWTCDASWGTIWQSSSQNLPLIKFRC